MDIIRAGRCLYMVLGGISPHLWVVLCDPIPPRNEVLLVMLTTAKRYTDDTVILSRGDHPFIRHDTAVSYGTARYHTVDGLLSAMQRKRFSLLEDMDREVLRRIQNGVLASPRTINAVRNQFVLPED